MAAVTLALTADHAAAALPDPDAVRRERAHARDRLALPADRDADHAADGPRHGVLRAAARRGRRQARHVCDARRRADHRGLRSAADLRVRPRRRRRRDHLGPGAARAGRGRISRLRARARPAGAARPARRARRRAPARRDRGSGGARQYRDAVRQCDRHRGGRALRRFGGRRLRGDRPHRAARVRGDLRARGLDRADPRPELRRRALRPGAAHDRRRDDLHHRLLRGDVRRAAAAARADRAAVRRIRRRRRPDPLFLHVYGVVMDRGRLAVRRQCGVQQSRLPDLVDGVQLGPRHGRHRAVRVDRRHAIRRGRRHRGPGARRGRVRHRRRHRVLHGGRTSSRRIRSRAHPNEVPRRRRRSRRSPPGKAATALDWAEPDENAK